MPSFLTLFNDQGRNSRQSSDVAEGLFGQPDILGLRVPILGMEISNVPSTYRKSMAQALIPLLALQFLPDAELSSAKGSL
jgi:hypothetical protein